MIGFADDDRMTALGHQFGKGQMGALDQRAGGVVNLMAFFAEIILDSLRCSVSGQEQGARIHLIGAGSPSGAGLIHFRKNVRIVNEIAQDGNRPLPGQPQGQVNRIAHSKAHAEMIGHPDFHCGLLSV